MASAALMKIERTGDMKRQSYTFEAGLNGLAFCLSLDGINESASGVPQAACVDQILHADVLLMGDIPIRLEDSAIVAEELFSDLLALGISKSKTAPLAGVEYCQKKARWFSSFSSGVRTATWISSAWM